MASLLTSFSSQSKLFIVISADNRIKLIDTDTKKEKRAYIEKDHLSHNYTCLYWFQKSADVLGLLAVGCSDGKVVIWDLVRGVVVQTIINGVNSITSVTFNNNGSYLFISDTLNYINQYQLGEDAVVNTIKTGKRDVQRIAMNPRVDVLAVAR